MGTVDPKILEFAIKGIKNAMKTIGMLEGEPFVVKQPSYLLDETSSLKSESDGIFYSHVDKGDYVDEATILGYTTDFWGNRIQVFYAPYSGIVVETKCSPAINKGENPVIQLAKVADIFNLE